MSLEDSDILYVEDNLIIDTFFEVNKNKTIKMKPEGKITIKQSGYFSFEDGADLTIEGGSIFLSKDHNILFYLSENSKITLKCVKLIGSGSSLLFNSFNNPNSFFTLENCTLEKADYFNLSGPKIKLNINNNLFCSPIVLSCSENEESEIKGNSFENFIIFHGMKNCTFCNNITKTKNTYVSIIFTDYCKDSVFTGNNLSIDTFTIKGKMTGVMFSKNIFESCRSWRFTVLGKTENCFISDNTFNGGTMDLMGSVSNTTISGNRILSPIRNPSYTGKEVGESALESNLINDLLEKNSNMSCIKKYKEKPLYNIKNARTRPFKKNYR